MIRRFLFSQIVLLALTTLGLQGISPNQIQAQSATFDLQLRSQTPTHTGSSNFHRTSTAATWRADETAVIVCDMWDSHHSVNAVRRVNELAPRLDAFVRQLRGQGSTVIHAPSSCMAAYAEHPARVRAQQVPALSNYPENIDSWCDRIPAEEAAAYPLDQSAGGEDDDLAEHQMWAEQLRAQGRNADAPWQRQIDVIAIDPQLDFISDAGQEIWGILRARKITNVMLVGVHTNMCVLGRPFGLRRLSSAGLNVVLVRDLTDTMYDPRAWPFANHFTGTDLIVDHVERYVCPTISSDQVLGGSEFRFAKDHRPQLTVLIAEDEYQTDQTLPKFAAKHLSNSFRVTYALGSQNSRHQILSLDDLKSADAVLVSVRRRPLPPADIEALQAFVRSGKPMIGIRTASHAFSLRQGEPEAGLAQWTDFDREVWGGSYTNHYANNLQAELFLAEAVNDHEIMQALGQPFELKSGGSLYKTAPLAPASRILIEGQVAGQPREPVAWTYVRRDGGRSFYTSLGHVNDFAQPAFETLLSAGIHWACGLPLPHRDSINQQNLRYASGSGKQRK